MADDAQPPAKVRRLDKLEDPRSEPAVELLRPGRSHKGAAAAPLARVASEIPRPHAPEQRSHSADKRLNRRSTGIIPLKRSHSTPHAGSGGSFRGRGGMGVSGFAAPRDASVEAAVRAQARAAPQLEGAREGIVARVAAMLPSGFAVAGAQALRVQYSHAVVDGHKGRRRRRVPGSPTGTAAGGAGAEVSVSVGHRRAGDDEAVPAKVDVVFDVGHAREEPHLAALSADAMRLIARFLATPAGVWSDILRLACTCRSLAHHFDPRYADPVLARELWHTFDVASLRLTSEKPLSSLFVPSRGQYVRVLRLPPLVGGKSVRPAPYTGLKLLLSQLPALEELDVSAPGVMVSLAAVMSRAPSLQRIKLRVYGEQPPFIRFAHMPRLRSLELQGVCVLGSLTSMRWRMPLLEELKVRTCPEDPVVPLLSQVARGSPKLNRLFVDHASSLQYDVGVFSQFAAVRHVALVSPPFSPEQYVSLVRVLPELESFELIHADGITLDCAYTGAVFGYDSPMLTLIVAVASNEGSRHQGAQPQVVDAAQLYRAARHPFQLLAVSEKRPLPRGF